MAVPGWHKNLGTRHADLSFTGDFAFPSLGLEQRRLPYFKQAALLFPAACGSGASVSAILFAGDHGSYACSRSEAAPETKAAPPEGSAA